MLYVSITCCLPPGPLLLTGYYALMSVGMIYDDLCERNLCTGAPSPCRGGLINPHLIIKILIGIESFFV